MAGLVADSVERPLTSRMEFCPFPATPALGAPCSDTAHYISGLCYMDREQNAQAIAGFERFLALYRDRVNDLLSV